MSSESSFGDSSSSEGSSDSSSLESCTHSQSGSGQAMARSSNARGDGLVSEHPIGGGSGPSHIEVVEENDSDVKIARKVKRSKPQTPCRPLSRGNLI
jgi:hypothetical protein